jgi:asparagine synthase (glutamine-hydrolysing)
MCGIVGAIGTQDRTLIVKMANSLHHRGPDSIGYCWGNDAHLGATRLNIIDLYSGSQPLYNETGQLSIAFNGEIYNHHELRSQLKKRGHAFTTETDTEVVLHLYEEDGENCIHRLHGMFAFAILDGAQLLLARDRLGIKPLYYTFLPEAQLFIFASEIKGILQCSDYTPRLDIQALADSAVLGHPVGTDTFFEGVKSLAAGHTMRIWCDKPMRISEQRPYFTRNFIRDEGISLIEAQEALEAVLRDSVDSHLAADVDVGLTVSGGLDSTILALLSRECQSRPVFTFTVADDEQHPDIVQGQYVAQMIGSTHLPVIMNFDDYLATIPKYATAEEQPSSLSGIPFYFLCEKIAHRVKACLHGEGADELFGGYSEYLDRHHKISYIRKRLMLLKQFAILPSEYALNQIERLASSVTFDEYLQSIFAMNLGDQLERFHLDPVDKHAMAASVEMRVPYLDDHVFELVSQFPLRYLVRKDLGIRKYILRRLCLHRFGYEVIDIVLRHKLGVPAAGIHLLDRFDHLCETTLPDDYLARHEFGYFFERKRQLLMFELFHEIFMTHRGDGKAVGSIVDFLKARQS